MDCYVCTASMVCEYRACAYCPCCVLRIITRSPSSALLFRFPPYVCQIGSNVPHSLPLPPFRSTILNPTTTTTTTPGRCPLSPPPRKNPHHLYRHPCNSQCSRQCLLCRCNRCNPIRVNFPPAAPAGNTTTGGRQRTICLCLCLCPLTV